MEHYVELINLRKPIINILYITKGGYKLWLLII